MGNKWISDDDTDDICFVLLKLCTLELYKQPLIIVNNKL